MASVDSVDFGWFSYHIWLVQIGILLLIFYFANRVLKKRSEDLTLQAAKHKEARADYRIAILLPLRVFLGVLILSFSIQIVGNRFQLAEHLAAIRPLRNAVIVLCCAWVVMRWKEAFYYSLIKHSKTSSLPLDTFSLELIRKLLNIFIIFITMLVVLQSFGLDIVPFVTFGGIGVAAVGFASKDVIANYFSGFMIYATRPFSVGDLVELPEKKLQGIVEEIGWYLISLRGLDKKPIYVPNSVFSTGSVINISRVTHRFFHEIIQIRYKDLERVIPIAQKVRAFFESHPQVDQSQMLFAFFREFGTYSLDLETRCYINVTRYDDFLKAKQQMLLEIGKIVESEGGEMAFPTSVIHTIASVTPTS